MKYLKNFEQLNTQLFDDVKWIKEQFSDYREIQDFFNDVEKHLYKNKKAEMGFGYCNDTKSDFQPIMKDIAIKLISNNFNLNIKELEKTYMLSYYESYIHRFRKYMEQKLETNKKYYYYKTIKKYSWISDDITPEEKMEYIRNHFKEHQISKKYDIRVNIEASFITVNIIEK